MADPGAYARSRYLPEGDRTGMAVCLSGGGFRASLFHLGALRRLNELGVLSQVTTITAVSGGSIIAAHLATHWHEMGEWEPRIAVPFRAFTGRDLRTGPILTRLLPWNWLRTSTAVRALAAAYERRLTPLRLRELPTEPEFVFCATDMAFGVAWVCQRTRVGDYQAGYTSAPSDWPVAKAVAASSCFPPVFNPLPTGLRPDQLVKGQYPNGAERNRLIQGLRLTDGGVYDNLGLEPVWKTHRVVLVSDGGGIFTFEGDKNLLWRLNRYTAIQGHQVEALRKRWLMSNFSSGELAGTYWGVGSVASHYGSASGYSESVVRSIARIRTDLDAFSEGETAALENHGYLLTDAAMRQHAASLVTGPWPPCTPPHPDWIPEGRVAEALKDSSKRKVFGH